MKSHDEILSFTLRIYRYYYAHVIPPVITSNLNVCLIGIWTFL